MARSKHTGTHPNTTKSTEPSSPHRTMGHQDNTIYNRPTHKNKEILRNASRSTSPAMVKVEYGHDRENIHALPESQRDPLH